MRNGDMDPEAVVGERVLRWFGYSHLPEHLQDVSRAFSLLATHIIETIPESAERSVALRKLLESKDAAVRAYMEGHNL